MSVQLVVLKLSGSKPRLPLLLRCTGIARLPEDSGSGDPIKPTWTVNVLQAKDFKGTSVAHRKMSQSQASHYVTMLTDIFVSVVGTFKIVRV